MRERERDNFNFTGLRNYFGKRKFRFNRVLFGTGFVYAQREVNMKHNTHKRNQKGRKKSTNRIGKADGCC